MTAAIRAGEVVRIDGPHASALCEVIRGSARRAVRIAADDRLPGDPADALRVFAALAGARPDERRIATAAAARDDEARAAARGTLLGGPLWIVEGPLGAAAEDVVQAAAEEVRDGAGSMVWTASPDPRRARVDRTIVAATPPAPAPAPRRAALRRGDVAAVVRYAAAIASSRVALGLAALAAGWVALVAWTVAAHEGFWFAAGSAAATAAVGPLTAAAVGLIAAVAVASRAAASATWPAMLRDTGAPARVRAAAVLVGDVAIALPALAVAAIASAPLASVVLGAALAAAVVARALRGTALGAAAGALAGAAATAIALW